MRTIYLALLVLFLLSCSGNKVPDNVLPPAKMQAVLYDLLLAGETANYYLQTDTASKAMEQHVQLYKEVFQIHQTSKQEFEKSLRFYESRPDLLKTMLDSMQKKAGPQLPQQLAE